MEEPDEATLEHFTIRMLEYLRDTHDPRLIQGPDGSFTILDMKAATKDFCDWLVKTATRHSSN